MSKLTHYGLDRLPQSVNSGKIYQPSKTKVTPHTTIIEESHPTIHEILRSLRYVIKSEADRNLLRSLGLSELADLSESNSIPLSQILRQLGWSKDAIEYEIQSYPLAVKLTPKLVASRLACGAVNRSLVPQFGVRLIWVKPQPLIKIDIDVFRTSADLKPPKQPQQHSLKAVKVLEAKRVKQRDRIEIRTAYREASDLTQFDLVASQASSREVVFRYGLLELSLVPSHNKGKHIAVVRGRNMATNQRFDLGTIKHHKGKLVYAFPELVLDQGDRRDLLEKLKHPSYSREGFIRERDRLKALISELGKQMQVLKAYDRRAKTIDGQLDTAQQILELQSKLSEAQSKLSSLSDPAIADIKSAFHRLDKSIACDYLCICQELGLNANNFLKSIPQDSPLNSIKFWGDRFGVVVTQQHHTKPIEFVRDLR